MQLGADARRVRHAAAVTFAYGHAPLSARHDPHDMSTRSVIDADCDAMAVHRHVWICSDKCMWLVAATDCCISDFLRAILLWKWLQSCKTTAMQ